MFHRLLAMCGLWLKRCDVWDFAPAYAEPTWHVPKGVRYAVCFPDGLCVEINAVLYLDFMDCRRDVTLLAVED